MVWMLLMMPIMMFPLAVGEWGGEVETTETDDGIEVDLSNNSGVSPCSAPCFNMKKGLAGHAMGTKSYTYISDVYMIDLLP